MTFVLLSLTVFLGMVGLLAVCYELFMPMIGSKGPLLMLTVAMFEHLRVTTIPQAYLDAADEIVPNKEGGRGWGWGNAGDDVRKALDLPYKWSQSKVDEFHLHINWDCRGFSESDRYRLRLTNSRRPSPWQTEGRVMKKPWDIDQKFSTRNGAVRALANSLHIIDQELVATDVKQHLLCQHRMEVSRKEGGTVLLLSGWGITLQDVFLQVKEHWPKATMDDIVMTSDEEGTTLTLTIPLAEAIRKPQVSA